MAVFLGILAIAFIALAGLSMREQRRGAERAEQRRRARAFAQTSAACSYIDALDKTRVFPLVPAVNLKSATANSACSSNTAPSSKS
ncbi:MAG: hypothetical protein WDN30_08805 [Pararobbsia sp.]